MIKQLLIGLLFVTECFAAPGNGPYPSGGGGGGTSTGVYSQGTNYTSINTSAVYTNLTGASGLLVGYVNFLSPNSSRNFCTLTYTNSGTGYTMSIEVPNTTSSLNSSIPFSIPLVSGGTFMFSPSGGNVSSIAATIWNGSVGNGAGLTNNRVISNDGYTVLYATNYGVQGVVLGLNASLGGLVSQDAAMTNFVNALSNNAPALGFLPAGIIKMTNAINMNFSGFKLVGVGLLHQAWGNSDRFGLPYSVIWQSNTNLDGIHLNGAAQGTIRLQDFEIVGGTNPVHAVLDAAYYTAPIYSTWVSGVQVTNKNQLSKVGLTIRDVSPSGGIQVNNVSIDGFKIGVVNGGNDEKMEFLQTLECDLGFFNSGSSADPGFWNNFTDCTLNMGAYGALIDTNLNGTTLGVPDQVVLDNYSFCFRRGGVAFYLERDNGFQINTSSGIDGPRTYAILASGAVLSVNGGNDEPDGDIGTNWIYCMQNVGGVNITGAWVVQAAYSGGNNVYGEPAANFSVVYSGDNYIQLCNLLGFTFNGGLTSYVNAFTSKNGGSVSKSSSSQYRVWESGVSISGGTVYDWGNGDSLAPGIFQPSVGNGWPINSQNVQVQLLQALGRFLTVKDPNGDFPIFAAEYGTPEFTNINMTMPLMYDGVNWTNFYSGTGTPLKRVPKVISGIQSLQSTNAIFSSMSIISTNRLSFSSVSSFTNTLGRDVTAIITAGTSVALQDTNGVSIATIGTIATLDVLIPMHVNMRIAGTAVSAILY